VHVLLAYTYSRLHTYKERRLRWFELWDFLGWQLQRDIRICHCRSVQCSEF